MIADMISNENLDLIGIYWIINSNISINFIIQSYFPVPKNIRLKSAHYIILKILYKCQLQQTSFNQLSDTVGFD